MNIAGIIPARFNSSRFPGKPLAVIGGKTMIRRVYEQAAKTKSLTAVIVATDDRRIEKEVVSFGGNVVMTSPLHRSGTERCAEALDITGQNFHVVINIQGDEPLIDPKQIDLLAEMFVNKNVEIATLSKKINNTGELQNPNVVKVVFDNNGRAMYFSRFPIPFLRDEETVNWHYHSNYFKHIGIYGYRSNILKKLVLLKPGLLEQAEKLEQLRWIENGYVINVKETKFESIAIDTPEDLKKLSTYNL